MLNKTNQNILSLKQACNVIEQLRNKGMQIVLTNGCFDLLHVGHLASLKFAKSLGDILVVAINDDSSVQRLKGKTRPIIPIQERAEIISELKVVDYVIPFHQNNAVEIVKVLRPDIYVKGADYNLHDTPEGNEVNKYGGTIKTAPFVQNISTTAIVKKIIGSNC